MSKHSNIQSQNIQASLSHRNQPQPHQLVHSQHPHIVHQLPQKEWIATYLDGQYFLTDPESISKLKNIEAEIEIQRNRLAKLDQENISNNNSFLSYQEDQIDKQSNKSFCNTEFDQSRHLDRQERVKNDLEKEEELYKQKLKNAERQKIELKKNMKQIEKKQSEKQVGEKKIVSSRKQSVNKEMKEEEVVAGSPSKKMSKRASQEEKEKSYHKSRIQKSIKDNLVLNEQIKSQSPQKSAKASEKVNSSKPETVKESSKYEVVVLQPPREETNEQIIEADMRKKEEVNSIHSEVKPKSIIDKHSKQGSVNASQKLSEVPSPSRKSKAVSIFNDNPIETKSVAKDISVHQDAQSNKNDLNPNKQEVSVKKSTHNEPIFDHKSERSHARSNVPFLIVETKEVNDIQSVKKSERSVQKSVKVSQKPQQQLNNSELHSPSRKSKASSIVHESIPKDILINEQNSRKASVMNDHTSEKIVAAHKEEKLLGAQLNENRSGVKEKSVSQHSKQVSVKGSEKKSEKLNESQLPSPSRKSKAPSIINEASIKNSTPIEQQIDQKSQKSGVKSHFVSIHSNNKVEVSDIQSEKKVNAAVEPLKESSVKGSQKLSEHFNKSQSRSPSRKSKASSVANEVIITKEVQIIDQQSNKGSVKESSKSVKSQLQNQSEAKMEESNHSINMKKKEESFVHSKPESVKGSIKGSEFEKVNNINNIEVFASQVSKRTESKSIQNQQQSEKNSSYIINNQASMGESSHLKLQMLNNQLQPSVQDAAPQINMKKKEQFYENQSQKKSKSFVIHSKQGSVKERSQKHADNLHNSKASSKSKGYSIMNESSVAGNQSVTKEEILKLHEQIGLLQLKLQKVEEKQQQMQRFEGTLSKIQQAEVEESVPKVQQTPVLQDPRAETPIIFQNLHEVSIPSKIQPRLQIESSILQVNTIDEMRKKQEKESEHNQKSKLKDEISRLKKIIRDMQIQKIKSIDHEAEPISPLLKLNEKPFDGKDSREIDRESRMEMESINSFKGATQRRFFGSTNKRLLEDAGKIVHNNSNITEKGVQTPRRRSIQKLKFTGNEDDVVQDQIELPNESNNKKTKNKFYSEVRKSELVGRIGDKEKDFHNFIESSRVIAQESGNKSDGMEQSSAPLKNFSKISVIQDVNPQLSKINYSRMVQEMKKNNPEEQEILPEIHMRDIKMPHLPPCPNTNMTQQELLNLAKATYLVFGINVDEEDKQLCVKKYKNCVIFTLNNQHHQCILWHFSGKFFMGGWRTGEPGEGEKDGEGLEFIPDKHVYKGQFLNGKKNGTGILKLTNGNIYDGQWIEGVKNGRGVYLDSATKVIYSGEWRDGKKQGQGYLKLSEKQFYYGTFVKSIKEGFGVEVFVNGDKYKGEYKNGKFHGKGKYVWANGSCYEGQFHQGVRHGQGSWKSAKLNGDIYIGTYETDKKNGYGRYVWANGCMYEGGFSNDVKHGKGRLTYQDGKQIKGVWEEGNLMSTESDKKIIEHEDQPLRRSVKVSAFGYPTSTKRI